ncbi:hypothetical protein I1E95_11465 [Synechococcus sp. CBW1107]|uniref:hypothetical protein n=1 Tax=Synechococcus sp. CBW1107 TaxID=2789857 RepID=UPI0018CCC7C1|nr:hypothetical protein [Synechococcus sp. CBW1107]QPN55778.1 hypothetical protein I1E95_11465 [Synechococcus sp. CBW1107]
MACHAFLYHLAHSPQARCPTRSPSRSPSPTVADDGFIQGVLIYGLGLMVVLVAGLQGVSALREQAAEAMVRSTVRQQLQLALINGGSTLISTSAGPFSYLIQTTAGGYRVMAEGMPSSAFSGKTLVGCQTAGSGAVVVQAGFHQPEPEACSGLIATTD